MRKQKIKITKPNILRAKRSLMQGCIGEKDFDEEFVERVVRKYSHDCYLYKLANMYMGVLVGKTIQKTNKEWVTVISFVSIIESYRRRGIGRFFLEAYMSHIREKSIEKKHIFICHSLEKSRVFYDKLGFTAIDNDEYQEQIGVLLDIERTDEIESGYWMKYTMMPI